jgi:hypothetical protein
MGENIIINFTEGWSWGWTAVGSIATCVLVISIGVAIWQIIEARRSTKRSTNAQIAVNLFEQVRDDEFKKNVRDTVYKNERKYIADFLDNDGKRNEKNIAKIEKVLVWYGFI